MSAYIILAGFYSIICLQHIRLNHGFIDVLIERWSRETQNVLSSCRWDNSYTPRYYYFTWDVY